MSGWSQDFPEYQTNFTAERLRRERHELIGELSVRCDLAGAKVVNGYLSTGDFNFSSVRARQDRAKLLAARANTNGEPDWFRLIEEFCQKVFEKEREGEPAIDLRTLPRPERGDEIRVDGDCEKPSVADPLVRDGLRFGESTVVNAANGPVALRDEEATVRREREIGRLVQVVRHGLETQARTVDRERKGSDPFFEGFRQQGDRPHFNR